MNGCISSLTGCLLTKESIFFLSSACNMKRFCKMSESVIRNLKIKFSARLDCHCAFKASAIDSSVVT